LGVSAGKIAVPRLFFLRGERESPGGRLNPPALLPLFVKKCFFVNPEKLCTFLALVEETVKIWIVKFKDFNLNTPEISVGKNEVGSGRYPMGLNLNFKKS
jgi:hypothetical protein